MIWIKEATKGYAPLWKVFWIYNVLGIGFLNLLEFTTHIMHWGVTHLILQSLEFFYSLWLALALWRCAFNTNWSLWGYVVRIMSVMAGAFFVLVGTPIALKLIDMGGSDWKSGCKRKILYSEAIGQTEEETKMVAAKCVADHREIEGGPQNPTKVAYGLSDAKLIPRPVINGIIANCADNCGKRSTQDVCDALCICTGNQMIRRLSQDEWSELIKVHEQKLNPSAHLSQQILDFAAACKTQ